ncbi:hopene-associated glycosyltransferase HpnB [Synechococcus sp. PCC 7502]|uniref:glycosyltransferase n=1 Tax=Synechococcus sp. PCC 7502 TaxID=1173263 RepID=UPI00029FA967|nr:glycosyltransferase [Synechococcus sp. PCC 7502]AFY72588.1 hopene-associated glycosyltransferase HpnB [Synechococcus sp. PCC 7502]
MPNFTQIWFGFSVLSLLIWLVLIGGWGGFWRCDQQLDADSSINTNNSDPYPSICVVIPARNEADLLPITLRSLLTQTYRGSVQIIVVDDQSTDGTAAIANDTAKQTAKNITIINSQPLPTGWTGKLWAMAQGTRYAQTLNPDYILLTDADICHGSHNLQNLVAKAETENLDLTSIMVRLRCESRWEQWLIPAFVFFFQKLYPFAWVNNPQNSMAAAAGGCILIKTTALDRIGGISSIRQALIDDCALAQAVKSTGGKIWLGLSDTTCSLRPYPNLQTIWDMVARTAYTQLNYSPLLLIGTLIGMGIIYILPPLGLVLGLLLGQNYVTIASGLTLTIMTISYIPTIRFYRCPWWLSLCLPAIAFLYTLMTMDSAWRHWQGKGGAWKGRVYQQ